ncbi:hypothetical protein EQ875_00972 [Photobacterium damselae subsp. damselae]|uniref:Protein of uncharacterized function (DUF1656) n=1 Tax=Photobacterium damselae TaxID=38293 RepID=A0A2X1WGS9_PHODM|nr:DUF1656 domain-containing protein [Photobacterium damselae]MBF7097995.1 DUF1656 domain-containing protein [Photobacterium damselae]OEC80939.1 hypothetical protein A9D46_06340 [Photobacterium damselae subsp. damselae]TGZ36126.1 hypothetical protein EQ875_00972 [Photobacterium damselae subsp. damselae]SPY23978.1 Protein of uncharacterised function (DUF1656) [Photobacterium damselae]SPY28401.1 Protein of uncharacterised function (DUF1656) [Photobacterium damselae]
MSIPHELSMGDIYYSPVLLVAVLSLVATWITVVILNKTRLSRFIAYPSLTFLAIMVFYVVAIDTFYIQI